MDEDQRHEPSHLFLVRLWLDQGNEGHSDSTGAGTGHGKVQHVITGEARPFSDWSSLVDQLASLASAPSKQPSQPPSAPAKAELDASHETCDTSDDYPEEK